MDEPRAQRTLVKSPPELWAEVSDADALAAHLAEFGEIRITRAEPETTVAWEGDRARGTVELEPTAWGTKVTLTAAVAEAVAPPARVAAPPVEEEAAGAADGAPETEPAPAEPAALAPAGAEPARGFLARLFGRRRPPVASPAPVEPEPVAPAPVAPVPPERVEPVQAGPEPPRATAPAAPLAPDRAREILGAVLDDLGSAHHRPFSR